ncbi:MAG: hypothetical protein ACI8YQ_003353 [Polaribacter sp.]|jgi:hypothetical protein
MESKIITGSSSAEVKSGIEALLTSGFKPTLAIAFGSISCDIENFPKLFSQLNIQLIGASSCGEFTGTEVSEKEIVVMLLDIAPEAFRIFDMTSDYATSEETGKELGQFAKTHFEDPSFILLFSMNISGECLIKGINDEVGGAPSLFGGMAGDDFQMNETFNFSNNHFRKTGITALVLDNDKVEVKGKALCGWQPIGVEHQITNSKDNIIYTINDKPALDVMKEYFGNYHHNGSEVGNIATGTAQYPLQLRREDNVNILRTTLNANESEGSLVMAGPVKQGDLFQFSVAPGFDIIDETLLGFEDFQKESGEADAMLLFSCMARKMALGPLVEEEVKGIHNIWKKPMIGFFTYGEIGQHGTGTTHFYNETCSLVLLKERK